MTIQFIVSAMSLKPWRAFSQEKEERKAVNETQVNFSLNFLLNWRLSKKVSTSQSLRRGDLQRSAWALLHSFPKGASKRTKWLKERTLTLPRRLKYVAVTLRPMTSSGAACWICIPHGAGYCAALTSDPLEYGYAFWGYPIAPNASSGKVERLEAGTSLCDLLSS